MIPKLLALIPQTNIYCEPYGGAASVLFARPPAPVEVYNDLDKRLVGFFRTLQDPLMYERFKHRIEYTIYSREEFILGLKTLQDDEADQVDKAWAFFVTQNQGFSGTAQVAGNWSRVFTSKSGMADNCAKWVRRLRMLDDFRNRIMRVQIDCRDAVDVLMYWDSPETTFYLDPPYVKDTRSKGYTNVYAHECDDDHHNKLVAALLEIKGAAVLSGYPHEIYQPLDAAGWDRIEFETACYAAGRVRGSGLQGEGAALEKAPRTEVIWRNRRAVDLTGVASQSVMAL